MTSLVLSAANGEVEHADRAVDARSTGQHAAGSHGVFRAGDGFVGVGEVVVDRRNTDVKRSARSRVGGVGHLRNVAIPVGGRFEGVVAVTGDDQRADTGDGCGLTRREVALDALHIEAGDAQDIIDILVVGQHVASRVVVFVDGDPVSQQHAGVIDGSHVYHQWQ
ncbi:hypothetical protein D3C84_796860 [compost metagenome]